MSLIDKLTDSDVERFLARIRELEEALRKIVRVLGPEISEHGCEGCEEEMAQALKIARNANRLAPEEQ